MCCIFAKTKKFKHMRPLNYIRSSVKPSILHFGVGNFHRAHLQSYTNTLLNLGGSTEWGISGAMLLEQDKELYHKLKQQEGLYSLTVCSREGGTTTEWIGSLVELLWSGDSMDQIIARVANSDTRIISLTITEGGYNLDGDSVQHDIKNPSTPKSVFGVIAEGLRLRKANNGGPLTILTCDNLQHNGDVCKDVFSQFFALQDSELASWAQSNITYPNSMVDRITPATTSADVERINATLDQADAAPVYCEDYIQWVIEDNFAAGRPEWEKVGVEFTDDVTPYENMKLSLLNASHTLLSYPSFLSGLRKVDAAMQDSRIIKFVTDFMNLDATPWVPAPKNTNLDLYKKTLIERFANAAVSDQISRLCGDGASKFPVYVMPIASKMLPTNSDMTRIAYLLAAYYHYLKYRTDDNGATFDIFEPQITASDLEIINSDNALDFLTASPFCEVNLTNYPDFVSLYLEMTNRIKQEGAMKVLESII